MPSIREAKTATLNGAVKRIELPATGGYWTIDTRPSWGRLMKIRRAMESPETTDEDNINIVLVELTEEWSFDDAITSDAIELMDIEDIAHVMQEVNRSVLPLFERMGKS